MTRGAQQGSRSRQAAVALVGSALAWASLGGVAMAGDTGTDLGTAGGLNYRVNVAEDFSAGVLNSFVQCVEGDKPISGGIDLQGSATQGRMGSTYPSSEFGGPLAWRSSGHLLSASQLDMSFYAVCRKVQPGVQKLRSATKPFEVGERRTVKAPCPEGYRVTGGGLESLNPIPSASVPYDGKDSDKKPDDGWKATAVNGNSIAGDLIAWASCREAGSWDLLYQSTPLNISGGGSGSSTEACDGATTGGGGSINGTAGQVRLHETFPDDFIDGDSIPQDAWTTSFRNALMGTAAAKAYIICRV